MFNVYQWFKDGSYEKFAERVPAKQAVRSAEHLATSVGALMGTTVRVIITDSGDSINWEWKFGEGIVFPRKES